MAASELEFYLFRDRVAGMGRSVPEDFSPSADMPLDYHIGLTRADEPLLRELRNRLDKSGVSVESSKGETGKGQYEIALVYQNALEMADRHILFKDGVKAIAGEMGYSATFMAKYSGEDSGSSGHIHMSLVSPGEKKNLFREEKSDGFNSTFTHFLGGIMSKTAELFLLSAPTVNSYKRFRENSFAPVAVSWGIDNRTAAYRAVGEGESLRL
jgi:glutamine synthetase